jgi:putative membrane protein
MSELAWSDIEVAGALLPAVAYLVVMLHVRRFAGGWPAPRGLAFIAAVAAWAAVTCPAFDAQAQRSPAWHMSQQMTLLLLVPPALVFARPLELLRRVTGGIAWHPPGPAMSWIAFVGIQWALHVPPVLDAIVGRPLADGAMHIALVAAGAMFFAQVAAPGSRMAHPFALALYLASAMPTTDAIALLLILDPHVIYSSFAGPGALADQQTAGVIMFAGGNVMLVAAAVIAGRYLWEGRPAAGVIPGREVSRPMRRASSV